MSANDIEQCKRLMSRKDDIETELQSHISKWFFSIGFVSYRFARRSWRWN